MANDWKNILIIKPSSLGDIVMALPALKALHESFPDAKISWLVRPEFAPLLEGHPCIAHLIPFDRKLLGKAWCSPEAFHALLSLLRRLSRSRFDAVVDFQGLFRTAALAWLSGCKNRFGMADAREFAYFFYSNKVPQHPSSVHVVDCYLNMTRALGAANADVEFIFPADPAAADSANRLLTTHGVSTDNYAVLIPGSSQAKKCWPVENFAELAEKITTQFGCSVVATGTKEEKPVAGRLKELASVPVVNLVGLTNLRELTSLLRNAKVVVSNDTGPAHIAAGLGRPLVIIFGPSNPVRLYPYGRKECVAAIDPFGRGLKLRSSDPKHDIRAVTIEQVYQTLCRQFRQNQA
jgi:lipopolysaccharide heptosyltransferase I